LNPASLRLLTALSSSASGRNGLNSQAKWLGIENLEALIVVICHPHEIAIDRL
jgi:hypothetical protein